MASALARGASCLRAPTVFVSRTA